jgi:hypothetical protein
LSYVDDLAAGIRDALPPELIPSGDTSMLFRMYAVLALAKGEDVVLEDVHDAWAAWMSGRDPDHRALVPFAELPAEVQFADQPYLDGIRAVARSHGVRQCRVDREGSDRHRTSQG